MHNEFNLPRVQQHGMSFILSWWWLHFEIFCLRKPRLVQSMEVLYEVAAALAASAALAFNCAAHELMSS
jgi:hypothetical protein